MSQIFFSFVRICKCIYSLTFIKCFNSFLRAQLILFNNVCFLQNLKCISVSFNIINYTFISSIFKFQVFHIAYVQLCEFIFLLKNTFVYDFGDQILRCHL